MDFIDLTATSNKPEPLSLVGNKYENWLKFKRDFTTYLISIEYDEKSDKVKVAKLLNLIGDEGRQQISTLGLDNSVDYKNIMKQLNSWAESQPRCLSDERLKFHQRVQKKDETFEEFFSDVQNLIVRCEFGALSEEFLRDKVVTGVVDCKLKDMLRSNPHLSLEAAVQICRSADLSEEQLLKLLSWKREVRQDSTVAVIKKEKEVMKKKCRGRSKLTQQAAEKEIDDNVAAEACLPSSSNLSILPRKYQKATVQVHIFLEECFCHHGGNDLCDLDQAEKKVIQIGKNETLQKFLDRASKSVGCTVEQIRPWPLQVRKNGTCRPAFIELEKNLKRPVKDLFVDPTQDPWNIFLEVVPKESNLTRLPHYDKDEDILIFFKYYDPAETKMSYLFHRYLPSSLTLYELIPILNDSIGYPPNTKLYIYEELTQKKVVPITDFDAPLKEAIRCLTDGDILIFQKKESSAIEVKYKLRTPEEYFEDFNGERTALKRIKKKPSRFSSC